MPEISLDAARRAAELLQDATGWNQACAAIAPLGGPVPSRRSLRRALQAHGLPTAYPRAFLGRAKQKPDLSDSEFRIAIAKLAAPPECKSAGSTWLTCTCPGGRGAHGWRAATLAVNEGRSPSARISPRTLQRLVAARRQSPRAEDLGGVTA